MPKNNKDDKIRFNLSTKIVYGDSSAIPPLAGRKKSYSKAKPRVDCWRKSFPSAKFNVASKSVYARINIPDEKNVFANIQPDHEIEDLAEESSHFLLFDRATIIDARADSENGDLPDEDLNDAYEYSSGSDGESENLLDEQLYCRTIACYYGPGTGCEKKDLPDEDSSDEHYSDEDSWLDLSDEESNDEVSWLGDPDLDEFDFSFPCQMNKMPRCKPRFNLSTKLVYCDSSAIPPLAGTKKSYSKASPRVDCWNKLFSPPKSQLIRERIESSKAQMPNVYLDWLEIR